MSAALRIGPVVPQVLHDFARLLRTQHANIRHQGGEHRSKKKGGGAV
jgi:hypothetical protein